MDGEGDYAAPLPKFDSSQMSRHKDSGRPISSSMPDLRPHIYEEMLDERAKAAILAAEDRGAAGDGSGSVRGDVRGVVGSGSGEFFPNPVSTGANRDSANTDGQHTG